jgi:hypothetical protein
MLYNLGTDHTTQKQLNIYQLLEKDPVWRNECNDMLIMNCVVGECPVDKNESSPNSSQMDHL